MRELYYSDYDYVDVSDIVGKVIKDVEKYGRDRIDFITECGDHYVMTHFQSCCETVELDELDGDLWKLEGGTIRTFNETTESGTGEWGASITWTFYRIRTEGQFVHLTWRGSSNGYYSERVSFVKFKPVVEETDEDVTDWSWGETV